MSVIVYSPKEMTIIADRFVFDTKDLGNKVTANGYKTENKIIITDDKMFAYCFGCHQEVKFLPIILSFIKRFEMGTLEKDEKLERFDAIEFDLGIMTKRSMYRFLNRKKDALLTVRTNVFLNHYDSSQLLEILQLPALAIWETMTDHIEDVSSARVPQIVTSKELVIIPKARKQKVTKEKTA